MDPLPPSLTFEQTVAILKRRLRSAAKNISDICETARQTEKDPSPVQLNLFEAEISSLDKNYSLYEHIWTELETRYEANNKGAEFPSKAEEGSHALVKRAYFEAHGTRISFQKKSQPPAKPAHLETTYSEVSPTHYLPKMGLPKFSGDVKDWPKFKDTFLSLIHEEQSIPDIRKYHYLVTSLSGPALSTVSRLPLTADNYKVAWDSLLKAYDNPRILALSYLDTLLEFQPLTGRLMASGINSFLAQVAENISAFQLLQIEDRADFILYYLAARCFSQETREKFELASADLPFPGYKQFEVFLRQRLRALQASGQQMTKVSSTTPNPGRASKMPASKTGRAITLVSQNTNANVEACFICKDKHVIRECPRFITSSASERFKHLKGWSGCRNCLHVGHVTNNCTSKVSCRICSKRHHTFLHLTSNNDGTSNRPSSQVTLTSRKPHIPHTSVLLGTFEASAKGQNHDVIVRGVMDSGSQSSFITTDLAKKLDLPVQPQQGDITGMGNKTCQIKGRSTITLTPRHEGHPKLNVEVLVIDLITPCLPTSAVRKIPEFENYLLADPHFHDPQAVNILLGADVYLDVIEGGPIHVLSNGARLLPSIFGYIVFGRVVSDPPQTATSLMAREENSELTKTLKRFWELEEPGDLSWKLSEEEKLAEQHFAETVSRSPEGRYIVRLPFKSEFPEFPHSETVALKRYLNLEFKLKKSPNLSYQYNSFMQEYISLGHMEPTQQPSKFVLPHHAVHKEGKIRVVFDASAKGVKGSLNDHLLVGPKLQQEIWLVLLNFRKHAIVFTADIVKMYRQILVSSNDREYQHIFWTDNPSEPVRKYELKTVTYGLSSAPFLALRTLLQLAEDEGMDFPEAAEIIRRDVYVDDVVTGTASLSDGLRIRDQLISLLSRGGFQLSKWRTNAADLLPNCPVDQAPVTFGDQTDQGPRILGIQWNPDSDTLSFRVVPQPSSFTKRGILSTIAKIYDPLGYLSPITLFAKSMIQELWAANLDWDVHIGAERQKKWSSFCEGLTILSQISISRQLFCKEASCFQIIGFCDASQIGYGVVVYLRSGNQQPYSSRLLISKTKVAPLKSISIPRLELSAAHLLAKVAASLKDFLRALPGEVLPPAYFSDSEITLAWIRTPPHKLKTFVGNRVSKIVESIPPSEWYHVASKENPADCCSRGLQPEELICHSSWWTGPSWLEQSRSDWPTAAPINFPEAAEEEMRPVTLVGLDQQSDDFLLWTKRFSSFSFVIKVMGWILRFISRSRRRLDNELQQGTRVLTSQELREATHCLIRQVQSRFFGFNLDALPDDLARLHPFVDSEGLLRVGGRLRRAQDLPVTQRFPILLSPKSHITILMVDFYHKVHLHPGPSLLQALIQLRYWIPSLRKLVRQRTYLCSICFKHNAGRRSHHPLMGDLPDYRVTKARAFTNVGVDFGGPFTLKVSPLRKRTVSKAYLCLFICMCTKAVHLELVSNLSTDAFLASLDRFVARRGCPSRIYSDNGTNFVGASRRLEEFSRWWNSKDNKEGILRHVSPREIHWQFQPPYSPHMGGIWESAIKSAKSFLRKIVGEQALTFEEWATLLTKVEAILNSRPLCQLSSSPEETDFLTPGHFLVGGHLLDTPNPSLLDVNTNRLARWELLRQMYQQFWRKWSTEYLSMLHTRQKWASETNNLTEGDLVLIRNPNLPPMSWPLGRVVDVHPGDDGVVRVATVRVGNSNFRRSAHYLVPLPKNDFQD